jgi:putative ABC transport system permease protein
MKPRGSGFRFRVPAWLMGLRAIIFKTQSERELDDELRQYLESAIEQKIASGMTREAATHAARAEMGSVAAIKDDVRDAGWESTIEGIWREVKHSLRALRRAPGFTAITIATLALGIGGTTAVFSVVNGVLIKPLPYRDPDALIGIWHVAPGANIGGDVNTSETQFFTYREQNRTFQAIGLWSTQVSTVTGLTEPEEVRRLTVAAGTLETLGVEPAIGRAFGETDDTAASAPTVMLMHGYWQRRFGGDTAVIGRTIIVDAQPREVIGVMPREFRFLDVDADLILPWRFDRGALRLGGFNYQGLARLRPGVTLDQANADVARMNAIWVKSWPLPIPGFDKILENIRLTPTLRPLKQDVVGDIGPTLWILTGTIGFVLLIACANVANLLLLRVEGRQQELAVRAALGARWTRIARELMIESQMLALAGGVLGLIITHALLRLLVSIAPATLPRLNEISVDTMVLSFAFVVSLVAGAAFGLIPIAKYAGPRLAPALGGATRSATGSRERHRARSALVIAEVALSLILLVGAGLMIRTFVAMRSVEPGFREPEHVQLVRISIPEKQIADAERVFRIQREIRDRIGAIGGVSAASFASAAPMAGTFGNILLVEHHSYPEGQLPPVRRQKFVAPAFFSTVGIPVIAGRDLTWDDINSRRPVAIVSVRLAREMWRAPAGAIGKRIRVHPDDPWREVVGVVGDVHENGVHEAAPPMAYFPLLMENFGRSPVFGQRAVTFVIRSTRTGSASFLDEIREAVSGVAPDNPLTQVRTLEDVYDRSMARTSFTLVMLGIAACVALLLGIVGIYGVISYAVAQRTREIGIRSALGADQGTMKRMFVGDALLLAAAGVVLGATGALILTRFIASHLFGISPADPATYVVVSLVLLAAALLASYVPARRAARVSPLVALRYE